MQADLSGTRTQAGTVEQTLLLHVHTCTFDFSRTQKSSYVSGKTCCLRHTYSYIISLPCYVQLSLVRTVDQGLNIIEELLTDIKLVMQIPMERSEDIFTALWIPCDKTVMLA